MKFSEMPYTRPEKDAVLAALADFTFDSCFNYDPSPDAAPLCGLDVPTATITAAYVNAVSTVDKAAAKGVIHKNAANRKKARLAKRLAKEA